jgi:hypothetical protein
MGSGISPGAHRPFRPRRGVVFSDPISITSLRRRVCDIARGWLGLGWSVADTSRTADARRRNCTGASDAAQADSPHRRCDSHHHSVGSCTLLDCVDAAVGRAIDELKERCAAGGIGLLSRRKRTSPDANPGSAFRNEGGTVRQVIGLLVDSSKERIVRRATCASRQMTTPS